MFEAELAEPTVSPFSLVNEFIAFAIDPERNKTFEPTANPTNLEAQAKLSDAVNAVSAHTGKSLCDAYHQVVAYIAVQTGISKEKIPQEAPPVLRSAVRVVGVRECGQPAVGWGLGGK